MKRGERWWRHNTALASRTCTGKYDAAAMMTMVPAVIVPAAYCMGVRDPGGLEPLAHAPSGFLGCWLCV